MSSQKENFTAKELELMSKLKALEDDRVKFLDIVRNKMQKLEHELEVSDDRDDNEMISNFHSTFS